VPAAGWPQTAGNPRFLPDHAEVVQGQGLAVPVPGLAVQLENQLLVFGRGQVISGQVLDLTEDTEGLGLGGAVAPCRTAIQRTASSS
jgi:hypothetical protein